MQVYSTVQGYPNKLNYNTNVEGIRYCFFKLIAINDSTFFSYYGNLIMQGGTFYDLSTPGYAVPATMRTLI